MGKRTTARRLAMQILFQFDMGQADQEYAFNAAMESENFLDDTVSFAKELVAGTMANVEAIDKVITGKSIGWSLDRITAVDKAILRLAIYEIQELKTPPSIVINEAVNLAKRFSTEDSSKFVNGILGNLVK
jgi:transcription antitermination protein NusB